MLFVAADEVHAFTDCTQSNVLSVHNISWYKWRSYVHVFSNNALHNGELRAEVVVYAVFQISSHLSDSHGWLLVSLCNYTDYTRTHWLMAGLIRYHISFT